MYLNHCAMCTHQISYCSSLRVKNRVYWSLFFDLNFYVQMSDFKGFSYQRVELFENTDGFIMKLLRMLRISHLTLFKIWGFWNILNHENDFRY